MALNETNTQWKTSDNNENEQYNHNFYRLGHFVMEYAAINKWNVEFAHSILKYKMPNLWVHLHRSFLPSPLALASAQKTTFGRPLASTLVA